MVAAAAWPFRAQPPSLTPSDAVRFAVIGDNGTGDKYEYEVAQQMIAARREFPFEMVLMLGDNIYGRQDPQAFVEKFEEPYRPLLEAGVRFYASLGNHDNQRNRLYPPFNMGGERYYTFARKNVRFFVLDSDFLDPKQVTWIDEALKSSREEWKICYFHHPLYSDGGTHGSSVACACCSSRSSSLTASTSSSRATTISTSASRRRKGSTTSWRGPEVSCARATPGAPP